MRCSNWNSSDSVQNEKDGLLSSNMNYWKRLGKFGNAIQRFIDAIAVRCLQPKTPYNP